MGDWSISKDEDQDFMALLTTKSKTPTYKQKRYIPDAMELDFSASQRKLINEDDKFCTRDNVDQCIAYLNQELTLLGFPSMYQDDSDTFDMVVMVNNMHELLSLHQKSQRTRESLESNKQRTDNDIDHLQQSVLRLKESIEQSKRDTSKCQEKERQLTNKNKSLTHKLKAEKDEVKRLMSVIQHCNAQFKHDQKKKEREINKLKERLLVLMSDKSQERRIGMEILNSLQRADGKRGTWKTSTKHEEDMYRLIIGNYEEKQKELMVENDQLRQCLMVMQRELVSVINQQGSPVKSDVLQDSTLMLESDAVDNQSISTASQSVDELPEGYFNMPLDIIREGIEKSWKNKCQLLKDVIKRVEKSRSSVFHDSECSTEGHKKLELEVMDMKSQIDRYKDIIEQQETLIQSMAVQQTSGNLGTSFLNDSGLIEEKNALSEEKKLFYQQKASFEDERKTFTEAALRLGKERRVFEEERYQFLQQQFLQMSPFKSSQKNSQRSSSIQNMPSSDSGSARLVPSTPCFSPTPKRGNTPSTTDLYRTLGISHDSQRGGLSSGNSCNNSPRSSKKDLSAASSRKSSSSSSHDRVSEHMSHLKLALFNRKTRRSNSGESLD